MRCELLGASASSISAAAAERRLWRVAERIGRPATRSASIFRRRCWRGRASARRRARRCDGSPPTRPSIPSFRRRGSVGIAVRRDVFRRSGAFLRQYPRGFDVRAAASLSPAGANRVESLADASASRGLSACAALARTRSRRSRAVLVRERGEGRRIFGRPAFLRSRCSRVDLQLDIAVGRGLDAAVEGALAIGPASRALVRSSRRSGSRRAPSRSARRLAPHQQGRKTARAAGRGDTVDRAAARPSTSPRASPS